MWTLLDLAGSVALLLWGLHMVQTGIQRGFGPDLRRWLGTTLGNRLAAFAAGLGVTAVLQSSTATGLMVAGFAAGGAVALVPALAVMLGANVGTTLIVQVLSFDVAEIAPALVLLGVILFRRGTMTRTRDLGRVAIGLGLMLMALHRLVTLMTPFEDMPSLRLALGAITTEPVLDVLVAAGLTWAAHSSVAVVLLVMSLRRQGRGAARRRLRTRSGRQPRHRDQPGAGGRGRRRSGGAALADRQPADPRVRLRGRADPAGPDRPMDGGGGSGSLAGRRRLPHRVQPDHGGAVPAGARPLCLGAAQAAAGAGGGRGPVTAALPRPAALETPPIALAAAAREALRMADTLEAMLTGAAEALAGTDRQRIAEVRRLDDVLDRLNSAIKAYLTGLDPEVLSEADHRRLSQVLVFATNLEAAGDVVDRDVMGLAVKRLKRGVALPDAERAEARRLLGRLAATVRAAAAVFMTEDARAARELVAEKEAYRDLETAATRAHFAGRRQAPDEAAPLDLDLLRELKRVNGHLVAAAAYPILEGQGELLASRLRLDS